MKVALVHDSLVNRGGAERVFQIFCEMFEHRRIYTSVYLKNYTLPYFMEQEIITSPLQKFIRTEKQLKALFPLANGFMQNFDIEECDAILSSSTFCAKYVKKKGVKHYCYCYTPFRLLWNTDSYKIDGKRNFQLSLLKPIIRNLQKWDYYAAQNIDQFFAMTTETSNRIKSIYGKDSIIIPPPIDCKRYNVGTTSQEYYLIVSRLEPYKKVDLAIRAFNKLGWQLLVIGNGTQSEYLKGIAKKNIEFLGTLSDDEVLHYYKNCKAVIFPQKEDYGLVPLEANACGKPVICYGKGGVETTMIPFAGNNQDVATALFFYEQKESELINALLKSQNIYFCQNSLIANASRFDIPEFKNKILRAIEDNL